MKGRGTLFLISLMGLIIIITSLLTGIVLGGTGAITSTGEWTWMSGSDIIDQSGTYGTKGTPSTANVPGARWESFSWIDSSGDFWLFGGYGYDSAGTISYLNDLWRYDTVTPSVSTTTTTTATITATTPATSPGWTFAVFSVTLIAVTVVKRLYRKDD